MKTVEVQSRLRRDRRNAGTRMSTIARALKSEGRSSAPIHSMVVRLLMELGFHGELAADIGCGGGELHDSIATRFSRYLGLDIARYSDSDRLVLADVETHLPLRSDTFDAVFAVEVIEHVENPRALFRELVRICRPGGLIVVTTPNQLSLLSLLTLILRGRFAAFQDADYPAHISPLLEVDLLRMAKESALSAPGVRYSNATRIPYTKWDYPRLLARLWPRRFSDNLLMFGKK